jgi:hypothetical protein
VSYKLGDDHATARQELIYCFSLFHISFRLAPTHPTRPTGTPLHSLQVPLHFVIEHFKTGCIGKAVKLL